MRDTNGMLVTRRQNWGYGVGNGTRGGQGAVERTGGQG